MKAKANGSIKKAEKGDHVHGGPNWVLVAGGILLSTLSVRLGCRLKQMFETKQQNPSTKAKRRPGVCELHSNLYRFSDQTSYHCYMSGHADGEVELKQAPSSPISKSSEPSNLLVKVPAPESSKENSGIMWSSSPDRLEDPRKATFQYSNCSGSPSISESGSDICGKREVIQKLRQQLKRRDEMIMEMQAQIAELKNSLAIQATENTGLQSQLDATNRDLFESEREVQHLRKIVADHCVADSLSLDKAFQAGQWQTNGTNGHANGYSDSSVDDHEVHCNGVEKRKGEVERMEMLRREVGELKEVIKGKISSSRATRSRRWSSALRSENCRRSCQHKCRTSCSSSTHKMLPCYMDQRWISDTINRALQRKFSTDITKIFARVFAES
ncbi:unnamed protein product [Miscanthus lutarioriparius]|uniref:Uncharacterized protein n=1 Tax=Miscanthus lutarioriparius TaxID=422564 RepID=A0A811RLX1_9POAL|nr:unnamed protein product [Miscanthus lutarioriparius]